MMQQSQRDDALHLCLLRERGHACVSETPDKFLHNSLRRWSASLCERRSLCFSSTVSPDAHFDTGVIG